MSELIKIMEMLLLLHDHPDLTLAEISQKTGWHRATLERRFKSLRGMGIAIVCTRVHLGGTEKRHEYRIDYNASQMGDWLTFLSLVSQFIKNANKASKP